MVKPIIELIKLQHKQNASYMKNSNTSKPVKFWLDDYLNTLSKADLYFVISQLLDRVYELDDTIEDMD